MNALAVACSRTVARLHGLPACLTSVVSQRLTPLLAGRECPIVRLQAARPPHFQKPSPRAEPPRPRKGWHSPEPVHPWAAASDHLHSSYKAMFHKWRRCNVAQRTSATHRGAHLFHPGRCQDGGRSQSPGVQSPAKIGARCKTSRRPHGGGPCEPANVRSAGPLDTRGARQTRVWSAPAIAVSPFTAPLK